MKLPADVHEAFVGVAMRWLLENYTSGQRKLRNYQSWNYRETYLSIGSGNLKGDRPKNLKRLRQLVGWGFIVEPKARGGATMSCRFYLPTNEQADVIYKEAQDRHLATGYKLETMMEEIK